MFKPAKNKRSHSRRMKRKLTPEEWARIQRTRCIAPEERVTAYLPPVPSTPRVPLEVGLCSQRPSDPSERRLERSRSNDRSVPSDPAVALEAEYVIGIDEAGRGCILGPMFVGLVVWKTERLSKLSEWGVKDSKKLSDKRRRELNAKIVAEARHSVVVSFTAAEMEALKGENDATMNSMDEMLFARALETLPEELWSESDPKVSLFLDAADVKEERFGLSVTLRLPENRRTAFRAIVSKNHADAHFPIVSAASILAKEARETWVKDAHALYGDFKTGYCNPATLRWLEEYRRTKGSFPDICRLSWKPCAKIEEKIRSGQ